MFLYGAVVLVLFLNKNAAGTTDVATTSADRPKHEGAQLSTLDKAELARLIHHIIAADDEPGEDFDEDNEYRKVTKPYGAAESLDFNYYDLLKGGVLKTDDEDVQNLLKKNLLPLGSHADLSKGDYEIRVHLIKNPEVLQQYRENLRKRHESTSSNSGYDDSLEYDRKIENFIRRNAVFRLGRLSDQPLIRENTKFSLRNNNDAANDKRIRNSREDDKVTHFAGYDDFKEKILVSFKDTKNDNWDKPRHGDKSNLRNKNYYNDEPAKKDIWDEITKNANKWDNKKNGNLKKEKYEDYDSWNSKHKQKESKSNDWDEKNDWDKPKKDNNWDNWKSKSMEQSESYKRGSAKRDKPKINDDWAKKNNDWYKPNKKDDWDKPNKKDDWDTPNKKDNWDTPSKKDDWNKPNKKYEWDKPNKKDEWDKPNKKDDWEKPNKKDDWDRPNKKDNWDKPNNKDDWDKPNKKDDWDKPNKKGDWDKPNKKDDWDQPNKNDWDKPKKATKGIASYETEPENEYNFKNNERKDETKKTTNEWDRAIAKSAGASEMAKKKRPFVPVISDYYNPRPRIKDNAEIHGIKLFGRTSIPFVGKKGIYDEK